jgi:hypothetical protein
MGGMSVGNQPPLKRFIHTPGDRHFILQTNMAPSSGKGGAIQHAPHNHLEDSTKVPSELAKKLDIPDARAKAKLSQLKSQFV